MSNKAPDRLWEADRLLRKHFHDGPMTEGVQVRIEKFCGFEAFNTRPYHNYETWGSGYRVSLPDGSIKVEREDLDDAVQEFLTKLEEHRVKD